MGIPSSGSNPFYLRASSVEAAFEAVNSNFFNRNKDKLEGGTKEQSITRTIGADSYAYKAQGMGHVKDGLAESLSKLQDSKSSFDQVKSNVDRIKKIIGDASNGTIVGSALDDAQDEINSLVAEINGITANAKYGDKLLFDGNFKESMMTGLNPSNNLKLDFTPGTASRTITPALVQTFNNVGGAAWDQYEVKYADDKYIVATARYREDPNNAYIQNGTNVANSTADGAVFVYDSQTRALIKQIDPVRKDVLNQQFGSSVSVQGDKLIVGANPAQVNANVQDDFFGGEAYMFDLTDLNNPTTGGLLTTFTHSDIKGEQFNGGTRPSGFGSSVQIQGDKVFVVGGWHDDPANNRTGAIWEFNLDGSFVKKYDNLPNTFGFGDTLGTFEVNDNYIVGSQIYKNDGSGRMFVLDRNTGGMSYIDPPSSFAGQFYGSDFSVFGDKLLVGASGLEGGMFYGLGGTAYTGKAYLYDISTSNFGTLLHEFSGDVTLNDRDRFGSTVKLTGGYVLVGAHGDDTAGTNTGATYLFDANSFDLVAKSTDFAGSDLAGPKLFASDPAFNSYIGVAREYDFLSSIKPSGTSINLNTDTVRTGSMGNASLASLDQLSVSLTNASLGNVTGLVNSNTVYNINTIADNMTRMEVIFNSALSRVGNEYKRADQLQKKYFDASKFIGNLGVQSNANPNTVSSLLP